jgi:hypothetical protein
MPDTIHRQVDEMLARDGFVVRSAAFPANQSKYIFIYQLMP